MTIRNNAFVVSRVLFGRQESEPNDKRKRLTQALRGKGYFLHALLQGFE